MYFKSAILVHTYRMDKKSNETGKKKGCMIY